MLDLSALEAKPILAQPNGAPLELPLDDIEEDENQPRKEFDETKMREMAASIKMRGVRQPVSVRTHANKPGKWILNFGARRFRASLRAGKTTIPAFVDETSDDFDQVIENEERDNLKPMELALFIKGKLAEGLKKAEIARRLSRPASTITELLSLVDAPDCIEAVYRSGRCTSPKTLYDLRALYDKYKADVEAWCGASEEVTRKGVADLSEHLKSKNQAARAQDDEKKEPVPKPERNVEPPETPESPVPAEWQGDLTSSKRIEGADKLRKPLLHVEYEGRTATVLLKRRPSAVGSIFIRDSDSGEEIEVDARKIIINSLAEEP